VEKRITRFINGQALRARPSRQPLRGKEINHLLQFVCLASVLAAIGCATSRQYTADSYEAGIKSQAQFLKEASLCDKQAEADQKNIGLGPMDYTYSTYNRMFDACMRASGYPRKPEK
jgi:hypothetical protein